MLKLAHIVRHQNKWLLKQRKRKKIQESKVYSEEMF
jgi:hypothetical protein